MGEHISMNIEHFLVLVNVKRTKRTLKIFGSRDH